MHDLRFARVHRCAAELPKPPKAWCFVVACAGCPLDSSGRVLELTDKNAQLRHPTCCLARSVGLLCAKLLGQDHQDLLADQRLGLHNLRGGGALEGQAADGSVGRIVEAVGTRKFDCSGAELFALV